MKRKALILFVMVMVCFASILGVGQQVCAEDSSRYVSGTEIDYSFLQSEGALIGHLQNQTRGIYLIDGVSTIRKIDSRTAGAGGSTTAAMSCDVSVSVIVEQLKNGSWGYWTSWSASREDEMVVLTGRSVAVAPGYYYRVRCTHRAGTDGSSSFTSGVYF